MQGTRQLRANPYSEDARCDRPAAPPLFKPPWEERSPIRLGDLKALR
ncbi:hypothetical protein [Rhodomicrobium vannielii]|nr:hypothetical protein [Rhodomicrobium vannielii]